MQDGCLAEEDAKRKTEERRKGEGDIWGETTAERKARTRGGEGGFLRERDGPEHPAKEDSFTVTAVSLTLEVDLRRLKPNKALREKGILGYEHSVFFFLFFLTFHFVCFRLISVA